MARRYISRSAPANPSPEDLIATPIMPYELFLQSLEGTEDEFIHTCEVYALRIAREEREACSAV